MVNNQSPTMEKRESLEKYTQQKEAELRQGKNAELQEELKLAEDYLTGVANHEIADTVENSNYIYQKTKILRQLLDLPLNQTLDRVFNDPLGLKPVGK